MARIRTPGRHHGHRHEEPDAAEHETHDGTGHGTHDGTGRETARDTPDENEREKGHGNGREAGGAAEGAREPTGPGPSPRVERDEPDEPAQLPRRAWWPVLRRTVAEFEDDELTDRAAALTYYGVLSLFPALLVLVSLLGVAGESTTRKVLDNVRQLTPGSARQIVTDAVQQLQGNAGTGSALAVVGLLAALWSSSGYVAAFIRSANAVYDIAEGRPVWKVTPLRLAVTVVLMVLATASALIVVFTGAVARQAGTALGIGDATLAVWSIAKWPVLALLVTTVIAILYWAAPNVRGRGFRWITPGSFLALALWMLASGGFALYVANFGSYNRTYGTLAAVIVFLVWLWITNLAILLGLEFDAELARQRAIAGGHPAKEEPYVRPRDTRAWPRKARRAYRRSRRRDAG
ncbi:YihY/virulence factor BrkB family protein [Streptomyces sp. B1866]|uniref:YihY/virulence factor BrkB family protein n=1 Tax=Streptomyces sp. B1866 TaxID=3075431 RepID=UPI00289256D8|nr:YihY/virulence factor BrkB family protein [Streptomyces sp. B1866]MDT3397461.1 YihY/virulence factor BrkB family protein [Streptomyces sp. B1866]